MKNAAAAVAAGTVLAAALTARSGLDPATFDRSVAPQDDLYSYVNGGWPRDCYLAPDAAHVNVDAFYDAFAVTSSHRLYLAPADRVRIW